MTLSSKIVCGFMATAGLGLTSCGTMKSVGNATAEGFGKLAEATTSPFQPRVPIVKAREDALKDMPLGHEQALAYQQTQKQQRNFWISGPPVDFKEPELPDQGGIADTGLLPPKLE